MSVFHLQADRQGTSGELFNTSLRLRSAANVVTRIFRN